MATTSTVSSTTSMNLLTKKLAEIEISNEKGMKIAQSKAMLQTQTSTSKLLSKYGAPNPPNAGEGITSAAVRLALGGPVFTRPDTSTKQTAPAGTTNGTSNIDIGRYDGGFERENEKRGSKVTGPAAEALALDSSTSR